MTQIATVSAVMEDAVLVTVERKTACGHDCENCGGCGATPGRFAAWADAGVEVSPGDMVELESGSLLGYAALVYLVPVALFLAGCMLPFSQPVRYLCGGAGFALGIALAVLCDRKVRKNRSIRYRIVKKL